MLYFPARPFERVADVRNRSASGPAISQVRKGTALMEEIRMVDHRAFFPVYETDRNSEELLAKTYQVLAKQVPQFHGQPTRVLDVVSTNQKSTFMLEAIL